MEVKYVCVHLMEQQKGVGWRGTFLAEEATCTWASGQSGFQESRSGMKEKAGDEAGKTTKSQERSAQKEVWSQTTEFCVRILLVVAKEHHVW